MLLNDNRTAGQQLTNQQVEAIGRYVHTKIGMKRVLNNGYPQSIDVK